MGQAIWKRMHELGGIHFYDLGMADEATGLEDVVEVQKTIHSDLPIYALDVNSKFESSPGEKKIEELKEFKNSLALNN